MRAISAVAVNVFKESVRDRVAYNRALFAVLLIGASYLLGQLTAGQDVKIIKDLGLAGSGKVRINQAGCLDRCEEGPCIVIYPDAVWYTYVDRADIDEIIEEHLRHGRIVERLRI